MLTHIVCFKYRADTPEPEKQRHRELLEQLASIDGVVHLTVGEDVVRSARSFDTALIIVFENRAGLDAYQTHPSHVPVSQYGVAICENIVSVDF